MQLTLGTDYHTNCLLIQDSIANVSWQEYLTGSGYQLAAVKLALQNYIPYPELLISDNKNWSWHKTMPNYGSWTKELATYHDKRVIIYVPYVNRRDLLEQALTSLGPWQQQTIIIDQADQALEQPTIACYRWTQPHRFTKVMNWLQRHAAYHHYRYYIFLHSDAVVAPHGIEQLLEHAAALDKQQQRWGVIFTHYDALCLVNGTAVAATGCWDETFRWYVADCDYYNRLSWNGWRPEYQAMACQQHLGSQTLAALSKEEQELVNQDHHWSEKHYIHKWGSHWSAAPLWTIPYHGKI